VSSVGAQWAPYHVRQWREDYQKIRVALMDLLVNRRILWTVLRDLSGRRSLREYAGPIVGAQQMSFAAYNVSMVRQMVDDGKDALSLVNLLRDIAQHPEEISRRWYVAQWNPDFREVAERRFDALVGKGRRHLTREIVQTDLRRLTVRTARVVSWTNEHVAHRARRPTTAATFRDLRLAIENINRIANRYAALLHDREVVMPVIPEQWRQVTWARRRRGRRLR